MSMLYTAEDSLQRHSVNIIARPWLGLGNVTRGLGLGKEEAVGIRKRRMGLGLGNMTRGLGLGLGLGKEEWCWV